MSPPGTAIIFSVLALAALLLLASKITSEVTDLEARD